MQNKKAKPFYDLRQRIYLFYGSMAEFAAAMGYSSQTLSQKLNKRSPWKAPDIFTACGLLSIDDADIPRYFSA